MLLVKTTVQKSKTHGLGLFAGEPIKKGTTTWEYNSKFDLCFSKKYLDKLSKISKEFMFYYCYFDNKLKKFVLCSDNQKYINHTGNKSKENIFSSPRKDVAFRNIKKGEELLCDYNKFDPNYFKRMKINPNSLR